MVLCTLLAKSLVRIFSAQLRSEIGVKSPWEERVIFLRDHGDEEIIDALHIDMTLIKILNEFAEVQSYNVPTSFEKLL